MEASPVYLRHYPALRDLPNSLCQGLGVDEFVQQFIIGSQHIVHIAYPSQVALVNVGDGLPDRNHRVQVMGVHHCSDTKFMGDIKNQVIDD